MKKTCSTLWVVGLLMFLSAGNIVAQGTTATISGTVKDTSGAVLPGTQVVILNEETGISRTVETDADGRYSALALSLGNYKVTGSHQGFGTEVRNGITLTVGREAIVDLSLPLGVTAQAVEVTGEAPLVESTSATLGSLVDDRAIRALPLNGRSYDQLALLQPGVTLMATGATNGSPLFFGTGDRFTVGGQREGSNLFLLDGTDINDQGNGTPGGAAGTNLGVDTILEFKIFTNSFKAEYGHSAGSIVSSITRSGSNALHGTVFEYIRNSALDARNFFDVGHSPPSFKRNQFGGVLGGPIRKDKTFFFVGYEGLRQGLATTQTAIVPTALARQGILPTGTVPVNPAVLPFLNLYPLPNARDFGDGTADYLSAPETITNEDNVMGRVDHRLNEKTTIFARYSFDQSNVIAPGNIPSLVLDTSSRRQYATAQANSILRSNLLNNLRFAFNRTYSSYAQNYDPGSQFSFIPGQPIGTLSFGGTGSNSTSDITPLGPPTSGMGKYIWAYNVFEVGDDVSYIVGKHTFKIGADLQRLQDNTTQARDTRGNYIFTTLANLLQGTPSTLTSASPLGVVPEFGLRQNLIGIYAQDDYKINSRLTLNLGLRWETATDPIEVNGKMALLTSPAATATVLSDKYFGIGKLNFEPRFGLAWQLDANGKTVLRAGGGIYHNQILPVIYTTGIQIPPFSGTLSLANPIFPNGYTQLTTAKIALSAMAPFLKTAAVDQYNVSIQQQISRTTLFQIAYAGSLSDHLLTASEQDTAIPTLLGPGDPFYPANDMRRNTAWNGERIFDANGNSDYNSVTALLRAQSSSGLTGQLYYTFSKSMDNASNTNTAESVRSPSVILDPNNRARDWARSDFDATDKVSANFSYPIPFRTASRALEAVGGGWTVNGIVTFTSGLPFTARLAASVSRDLSSQLAERPNLVAGASQNPTSGTSIGCAGFAKGTPVGNPSNWYDPCAFTLPAAGTYGDVGRNTIIGPGLGDIDGSLERTFKLREKATMNFRAEMFNILNHANFGLPNGIALATTGAASPSAGVISYTTTTSRQLQFALRISF